jgi:trans-aconitate methyltransferase
MSAMPGDRFSNARAYEGYVGRWSRLVARQFIRWINPAPGLHWFDLGAGTGVLSQVILQETSPASVVGVDLSADYLAYARQHIQDERLEFRQADAATFTHDSPQFDLAVAGLVLNFLPSPQDGVTTMIQAVRQGGIVAAYVWDYSGQMEMMRHFWDAAIHVDPTASELDAGQRFAICKPDNLRALFESLGLYAVDVIPIDIQTRFEDFDDYWLPFLAAQGSVSKYLGGLDEAMRNALRDQLQGQLPIADDGSIMLTARAWAVKGSL